MKLASEDSWTPQPMQTGKASKVAMVFIIHFVRKALEKLDFQPLLYVGSTFVQQEKVRIERVWGEEQQINAFESVFAFRLLLECRLLEVLNM